MLKRGFDIVVSAIGLAAFAPVMAVLAVWIRLDSPGPVLYCGLRVGRNGKPFRIKKFRTMLEDAESMGPSSTSNGDMRITRCGAVLRKLKLDELPQLLNVLAGDMSMVGPRPQVQWAVDLYTKDEKAILALRPGITDWASIWNADEGSTLAGAEDPDAAYMELIHPTKMQLQMKYLREASLWTDVKIIAHTLLRIARKDWMPPDIKAYGYPLQRKVPS